MLRVARPLRGAPGYTLIEVLIVVAVIGITGAIVVPQILRPGEMGVQAAARMTVVDILHVQNDAVAHQRPRRISFDVPTGSYRITDENGQTIAASSRGGGGCEVALAGDDRFAGVAVTGADFGGTATLDFDDLGG